MDNFWINELETGYYDKVINDGLKKKSGIKSKLAQLH